MGQSLVFFLNILYQLLAFRSATLVEARVDGIFIWIHQLAHRHAQQQCLTVALGDAKAAQQLRCYLTGLVVSVEHVTGSNGVDAIIIG